MWGAGDYDAVASRILEVGEVCVERARVERGNGCARRGLRHRQRHHPRRPGGRARDGTRLPARPAGPRAREGERRRRGDRVGRGRRSGPALRGRPLRPRALHLRPHVRPRPRARRGGAEARDARGRRDQHLLLGAGGSHRAHVPHDGRVRPCRRRPARARRCCGAPRTTCASCSATAISRVTRSSGCDDSVETYADCMLESFGPLLNAQEALGERSGELARRYLRLPQDENLSSDGTFRFAASTSPP